MAEWQTQRDRRDQRELQREQIRRLKIEWQDKLWLAQNHPVDDSVLAWLSENRAEASKLGASRWNLETLPDLVARQTQLRTAAEFERILDRCKISTVSTVSTESRKKRADYGKARKRPNTTTQTR